jgi:hypothetical protein
MIKAQLENIERCRIARLAVMLLASICKPGRYAARYYVRRKKRKAGAHINIKG